MLPNNQKGRYWAFVLYLDSAPSDWKQILQDTGLPIAISPYHDRDLNADLDYKKPHYHIILCWDGPTTYRNVCSIVCDQLNQPHPIKLEAVRGYYRYLTHEDNPEKAQYNSEYISFLNNFCIEDYDQPSEHELDLVCKEILELIRFERITEYCDLMDILQFSEGREQHFRFARRNTIFIDSYIKSRRHKPIKDSELFV